MTDEHYSERGARMRDPLLTIDGQGLKRLIKASLAWLQHHQEAINVLNVFPVPDGDTGTNMLLTMQSAWAEIEHSPEAHIGKIAHGVAHGALMGARGNSGVILSQLWRGFARSLGDKARLAAADLVEAMQEGVDTAYKGVVKPVEGTILTVGYEVAIGCAEVAQSTDDLMTILKYMVARGKEAVARTPDQLPILKQAGVVDAGGQGYFVILEGMLRYLQGETVEFDHALAGAVDLHAQHKALVVEEGYGYDVQFIIVGRKLDVGAVREAISTMGQSALIVGDSEAIKVHVHVPDPGVPISYAVKLGSLRDVLVEDMQAQYQEFIMGRSEAPVIAPEVTIVPDQIACVVVAPGDGLARVFHSLGASFVIPGGQTMNPSTEQFLKAIEALPTNRVILLPNNSNVIMTARQAAELSSGDDRQVMTVPTRTIPQGIAAQLVFNPLADLEANVAAMELAAANVQTGEVTVATRDVEINGLQVSEGQVIGLLNDELTAAGLTVEEVVWQLLDQVEPQLYEIITLYYGDAVAVEQAEGLASSIRQRFPSQVVEVVEGGQPHYQYILSAE